MKRINVIGVFPPPYGGVTVKCKIIYTVLKQKNEETAAIDLYKVKKNKAEAPRVLWSCLQAFKGGGICIHYVPKALHLGCGSAVKAHAVGKLRRAYLKPEHRSFKQTVIILY